MAELSDLAPEVPAGLSVRRARVISIAGRSLTVDLGGPIVVQALDSCNPIPNQFVYLIGEGTSFTAIAAVGGAPRQSTITVTVDGPSGVAGLVNGVLVTVAKVGAFTATVGDVLPLFWSADGSGVWAGQKGSSAYVPPPSGSGSGGSPGGVTSGTSTYSVSGSSTYISQFASWGGPTVIQDDGWYGLFFYGGGRFKELQGRTISGFRINISRMNGSGTLNFYTHGYGSQPSGAPSISNGPIGRGGSGWISLPTSMANWLIAGSGSGGLAISGAPFVRLAGSPYGALRFDWSR